MARWIARLALVSMVVVGPSAGAAAAATPAPPATNTVGTVVDNDFIPVNRDLSDCVSALPKPDCGSKNRGGWRQDLVLIAVGIGLAFIGWQIVRGIRRNRVALDATPDTPAEPAESSPR